MVGYLIPCRGEFDHLRRARQPADDGRAADWPIRDARDEGRLLRLRCPACRGKPRPLTVRCGICRLEAQTSDVTFGRLIDVLYPHLPPTVGGGVVVQLALLVEILSRGHLLR